MKNLNKYFEKSKQIFWKILTNILKNLILKKLKEQTANFWLEVFTNLENVLFKFYLNQTWKDGFIDETFFSESRPLTIYFNCFEEL